VANIIDVARRAGVSPTTAKRAIRTPDLLAPATLEKVRRAVSELNYEPDQLAAALRSGHNKTIGLIVGSIVEPFFAQLIRTVGKAVREEGYTLLVADNEYDAATELEQLKAFYGHRIGGLILRSGYGTPNLEYLRRFRARGTAVVEIDYVFPDSPFSHVMLDNEGGVRTGVNYLASLGHRRIAALGTYHEVILPDERTGVFPGIMQEAGLSLPQAYQRVIRPTPDEAYLLTKELMGLAEPPTALFATTGNLATGAFRALKELQLKIPDDVSLLTFDDYPWTSLVDPPIDVIAQPVDEMGEAAATLVLQEIHSPNSPIERRRFSGRLLKRGSCADPRCSAVGLSR
jgi:LacI family transcriptional regulator